ncbi:hypothetical protein CRG98_044946 [Punica granatum]|uniref:Uncharacterized protein n=1 Tax=Punica granatum TaxID=22663 RepID=A0A2I0HST6_PUNGR|nr:hypothetical protein CRG98_044946 [Punica granatum]
MRRGVGDVAVGVARLGWAATGEGPVSGQPRQSRENGLARSLRSRNGARKPVSENGQNGGRARLVGPRIVTTSSRERVRVVRNPLNVMARLSDVVG